MSVSGPIESGGVWRPNEDSAIESKDQDPGTDALADGVNNLALGVLRHESKHGDIITFHFNATVSSVPTYKVAKKVFGFKPSPSEGAKAIAHLQSNFEGTLELMGYKAVKGAAINASTYNTAIIADEKALFSEDTRQGVLAYLRAGGVLVVNTSIPEDVQSTIKEHIPDELLSSVLIASEDGNTLHTFNSESPVIDISGFTPDASSAPSADFLYIGDKVECKAMAFSLPNDPSISIGAVLDGVVTKAMSTEGPLFSSRVVDFTKDVEEETELTGYIDTARAVPIANEVVNNTLKILGREGVNTVITESDQQNRAAFATSDGILALNTVREGVFSPYTKGARGAEGPISLTYEQLIEMSGELSAAYGEGELDEVGALPQNVKREDGDWKLELRDTLDKMDLSVDPRVRILIPGNNDQGTSMYVAQQINYIKNEYCGQEGKPSDVAVEVVIMGKGGHATSALYDQIGVMKPYATAEEQTKLLPILQSGGELSVTVEKFGDRAKAIQEAIDNGNIKLSGDESKLLVKNQFIGTPEAVSFGQTLTAALLQRGIETKVVERFTPGELEGKESTRSNVLVRLASESTNTGENVSEAVAVEDVSIDELISTLNKEGWGDIEGESQSTRIDEFKSRPTDELKDAILTDRLYAKVAVKGEGFRSDLETEFCTLYEAQMNEVGSLPSDDLLYLKERLTRVDNVIIVSASGQSRRQWLTFCSQYSHDRNNATKPKLYGTMTSLAMPRGEGFVKSFTDIEAVTEMYMILAEQCRSIQYAYNPDGAFIPAKGDIKADLEHIYEKYSELAGVSMEEAKLLPINQLTAFFGGEFGKLERAISQDLSSKGSNMIKPQQILARYKEQELSKNINDMYESIPDKTKDKFEKKFIEVFKASARFEAKENRLEEQLKSKELTVAEQTRLKHELTDVVHQKRIRNLALTFLYKRILELRETF